MKQRCDSGASRETDWGNALKGVCVATCQNLATRITAVKEAIFADAFNRLGTQERLLRLALNEAEAEAWATNYPQLMFPTLASEKVQAVMAWNDQQQSLRRLAPIYEPVV